MVKRTASTYINETGVDVIWSGFSGNRRKMDSVVVDLMEERKKENKKKREREKEKVNMS